MRLLQLAHLHLLPIIQKGDSVVDATAGNGHDSLTLAQAVGNRGHVHAFDIQAQALAATQTRLEQAGLSDCLHPHLCSHAEMKQHVPPGQRAIIFNLGYLPGANHQLITQSSSSIKAIAAALDLLLPRGRACIMTYPSHPGGGEEHQAIANYLATLPLQQFTVASSFCHNGSPTAPALFSIEKQR